MYQIDFLPTLERDRALDALVKDTLDKMSKAMGTRLEYLMESGVTKSRIRIEHHPDGRTDIVVDGIPDSEFFVSYKPE